MKKFILILVTAFILSLSPVYAMTTTSLIPANTQINGEYISATFRSSTPFAITLDLTQKNPNGTAVMYAEYTQDGGITWNTFFTVNCVPPTNAFDKCNTVADRYYEDYLSAKTFRVRAETDAPVTIASSYRVY